MKTHRLLLTISATLALLLGGCVVAPVGRPYYSQPVRVAPPPPRVEYLGVPPAPGYVWMGGFWNWQGGRHEWAPGHWEAPRPGYSWVPHQWVQDGEHWRLNEGRWQQHHDHGERRDNRREQHEERWERR